MEIFVLFYDVGVNTINYHLKKLFEDGEIEESLVIRKFRITASDGKNYNTKRNGSFLPFSIHNIHIVFLLSK